MKSQSTCLTLIAVLTLIASWGSAAWETQCIDCPPLFASMGSTTLQYDGLGHQIIAAGQDNLHLLRKNGTTWDLEIVDDNPAVGFYTSMKIDSNGFAHISYYDDLNNTLKYAVQTSSGWNIETVDATRNMGYGTSLMLNESDYPHIAYCNNSASNMGLYYAFFNGSSWEYETVQNEHVAFDASIARNATGDVSIAYFDYYDRLLKYATRDAGNWTIEILTAESECGRNAVLIMDSSDLPHILYHCDGLKHTWHNGTGWQTEQLNSVWTNGISLECDATNTIHASWTCESTLHYATWDGTIWTIETAFTAAADEILGWSSLLLTPGNTPEIAFFENQFRQMRYCVKTGSTWETTDIIQGSNTGSYGSSAMDQSGYTHASYVERNTHVLMYAWEDGSGWHTTELDDTSYVFYTSLDLDSNDAVHIGYHSTNPLAFKYTTNASGDWVTTTVATDAGQYCSLVVDTFDHVHAVFEETFLSGCLYGYFDGSTWTVETIEPVTGTIGGHLSICVADDGTPHISFLNNADMNLGYGYRTTQGWQLQMNVDDHWWAGEHTSIKLTSQGYPRISYCETQYDDNLRLASWDGTLWNIELLNNDPAWYGSFTTLQLDNNNFAHVACLGGSGFLYYFEDADGWHVADGIPCGPEYISLNLDATNSPVICYHDDLTWDYKVARYAGPTPPTTTPTSPPTTTPTPPLHTPTPDITFTPTPTTIPTQTPTQNIDTPTPYTTFTPTPITPTSTDTPSPTATEPGGCLETGVTVEMPSQLFKTGDPCWCKAVVCNAEDTSLDQYPLFVILDVYGSLFWAPSFNSTYDNYLALYSSFAPGETVIDVLPEFLWPGNTGSASDLYWYGALTDPEITDVFGTMAVFKFGWQTD